MNEQEKPVADQLSGLRKLPDADRAVKTRELALEIRRLPAESPNRLRLASGLANLSTEGDFGREALQAVATTLALALREQPPKPQANGPAAPYVTLAQLVRYERVEAKLDDPQFAAAMASLERDEQARAEADFTLPDLAGKSWNLKSLRGKVVLVNFWATWCPPCRKEMPDLEALSAEFRDRGLVVLAISDEDAGKVRPFVAEQKYTFPVLLDTGRKVGELFRVDGIPKTFIYNREGKLAAVSIDMRTRKQFLALLAQAGLN